MERMKALATSLGTPPSSSSPRTLDAELAALDATGSTSGETDDALVKAYSQLLDCLPAEAVPPHIRRDTPRRAAKALRAMTSGYELTSTWPTAAAS